MAKIQTRRTVSLNRLVYDAGIAYAATTGKPFSRVAEDLLLAAIGDEALVADVANHREVEALRTAPKPPRIPGKRGRPVGSSGTCSACGESGHFASRDGLCSAVYLACLDVENGASVADAAHDHSVSRQAIYQRQSIVRRREARGAP